MYYYVWKCMKVKGAIDGSREGCGKYNAATARDNPLFRKGRHQKLCECGKKTTLNIEQGSLIPIWFKTLAQASKWARDKNNNETPEEVELVKVEEMEKDEPHKNSTVFQTSKIVAAFARANKDAEGWAKKSDVLDLAFIHEDMAYATFYRMWKKIEKQYEVRKEGKEVFIRDKRRDWSKAHPERSIERVEKNLVDSKVTETKVHYIPSSKGIELNNKIKKLQKTLESIRKENGVLQEENLKLAEKVASLESSNETMLLLQNNRNLQSRVNEYEALIKHYELTIALLIGRLKDTQMALSSHSLNDPSRPNGGFVGQTNKQKGE